MSHVDDGVLHTFLDGALDELSAEEAARIRAHLESCETCAARLEEERALRDEASAILAGAAPPVGEMPPLEELRARAAARASGAAPRTGPRMRVPRLAWAASVVLALGAGWMLREATTPGAPLERALEGVVEQERAAPETAAVESLSAAAAAVTAERRVARDGVAAPVPPPAAATGVPANASKVDDSLPAELPIIRTDSAASRVDFTLRDRLAESPPADTTAARGEARRAAEERARAAEPASVPLNLERTVLTGASSPRAMAAPAATPSVGAGAGSLAVPGLEVLSVSLLEEGRLTGAVRILQRLQRGDTLELVYLPAGTDPSSLEPVADDGRIEWVVPRDGGWLLARARIPAEALRELLTRLEGR